jgi:type I restriction enzyme R subunit
MDYYKRYQEIIADYNREKDRVSIEETFVRLADLAASLDDEQKRVVEEGLTEEEYALFSLLLRENISKADRERLKLASKELLKELQELLAPLEQWTQKEQTQAEVEVFILDHLYQMLPTPLFTDNGKQSAAKEVYSYVWNTSSMWAGIGATM